MQSPKESAGLINEPAEVFLATALQDQFALKNNAQQMHFVVVANAEVVFAFVCLAPLSSVYNQIASGGLHS